MSQTTPKGARGLASAAMAQTMLGVFIDGVPAYFVYNKDTDWSQFVTFDIKEINISKGFTSVLYGHDTLGGAINIVTRKPQKELEFAVKA